MLLVDTNVVGNLLLSGPQGPAARALYDSDPEWTSEPLVFAELTNVLVTGLRQGVMTAAQARTALERAHELLDGFLHPTTDEDVLDVAARFSISGYDARFVRAALELGSPLVTEDAALRRKVPMATRSIAEALGA